MSFSIPEFHLLSGAPLAYLGDAVLELITRRYLLSTGVTDVGKLNKTALTYVRATAQSEAVERMLPHLTEEEIAVFKRGRNAHGIAIPKSASASQYRRATGMEALFAFLYLNGREERMEELFRIGYDLLEKSDDAD
jgi:ribonuclease-3 family protein